MFDLVIRRAVLRSGRIVDVGIAGDRIVAVEPALPVGLWPTLDAEERLVIRGYVDPHMHLDKALLGERAPNLSRTLDEAIRVTRHLKRQVSREDVTERALRVAEMAMANGVRAIRTHVDVDPIVGLEGLRALLEVREALKGKIQIQIVAFPQEGLGSGDIVIELLGQALAEGADLLGGIPAREADPGDHLNKLFALATERVVALDLHVDESDDPADFTLPLVIEYTRRYRWEGRVTVAHLCSLAAVPDEVAMPVIRELRQCGIAVVTLPSTNLYLQGRRDRGLIRRGTTRIRELLANGVQVVAGSDNLRDPFNPFGNANPVETAWLLAHLAHMGGLDELQQAFDMVTDRAAAVLGLREWDLAPGTPADLLILPVRNPAAALTGLVRPVHRIAAGKIVS